MRMATCSRLSQAGWAYSRRMGSSLGCLIRATVRQTASLARMVRRCSSRRTTVCCGSERQPRGLDSEVVVGRERRGLSPPGSTRRLTRAVSEIMQALVLKDCRKFALEDVPRPEVGPSDILVRVAACGICGSDVHGYDGSSGRRVPPIVMGHEAAGTVAEVGTGVQKVKVGDRVTFD